jgi:hypothetical protein
MAMPESASSPTSPVTSPVTTPDPPPPGEDWTAQVADRIESVVESVRGKTTVPITKIVRALVFGMIVATAGVVALVMGVILVIRLHVYLPFHPAYRRLWTSYAVLGAIFVLLGAFIWRKRSPRRD